MIEVSGKVTIEGSSGMNLVLNQGIERLLAGERLWDMLQVCSLGRSGKRSRVTMEGLDDPMGVSALCTKEEFFDNGSGMFIIKVKAEFPGALSGVREIAWGDGKGSWNRITSDKIEGFPASLDIEADETLTVELEIALAQVKKPYKFYVDFAGKDIKAQVVPVGLGNKLAWSAEGVGSNKGFGYWGTGVGLQYKGEEVPIQASVQGILEPYQEGSFVRSLRVNLGSEEGNSEKELEAVYFGTSQEGTRNIHWLWKLEFLEPFVKSSKSKLWLNLGWGLLRG